jgi:gluconokinase
MDKGQSEAQLADMTTKPFPARSPAEKVGGLVYFGRMLDKIRAYARGELPADYVEKLGNGFDGRCVRFLGISYEDLVARVKEGGGTDEEIFQWAFERGRKPSEEDMENWNEFMRKCGWKDVLTPTLDRRKKESGLQDRDDIETMFQYIDADEGRSPS